MYDTPTHPNIWKQGRSVPIGQKAGEDGAARMTMGGSVVGRHTSTFDTTANCLSAECPYWSDDGQQILAAISDVAGRCTTVSSVGHPG